MLFNRDFGIDLGSDTIKIYDRKNDAFSTAKNIVAVRKGEGVIAVGEAAYEMLEMTPRNVSVSVPLNSGRISDVVLAEAVIENSIFSGEHFLTYGVSLYFTVPSDMTEIERRAYASLSKRGRLRNSRILLVEKSIAEAVSLGINIADTKGSMIVNIGSFNTEMSVIAESMVILNHMVPVAGVSFTESIAASVRRKNRLALSRKTATEAKIKLAGLTKPELSGITVYGSDTESGLPRDGYVTAATVNAALRSELEILSERIGEFISRTPPQVLARIKNEGVHLTGGSSRIPGIGEYISKKLGMPVIVSPMYESGMINGLKELIINANDYGSFFRVLNG